MKPILPSMTPRLIASVAFLAAAPMLLTASRPASLGLEKSTPADGSTVDAVPEIRLWFTEAPMNMGPRSVSIRILGADGKAITTGNAARDAKDAKVYSLALPEGLEPRSYSIAWQTMAGDGEVVRGQFAFTVAAH